MNTFDVLIILTIFLWLFTVGLMIYIWKYHDIYHCEKCGWEGKDVKEEMIHNEVLSYNIVKMFCPECGQIIDFWVL